MRTMHLFAGAGGGLLADIILGHTPIAAIEWDKNCCEVLRHRADDGWFPGLHVHECDVRLFDPSEYAGRVDCIAAGFPCQDISAAGKGAGIDGERSGLYREVMRAVDVVRPPFVLLENSPRIRTRGRHVVIADLVARGYAWRDGILGAADVGAPHQRDRWWCVAANADGLRQLQPQGGIPDEWGRPHHCAAATADALRARRADGSWLTTPETCADIRAAVDVGAGPELAPDRPTWFEAEPDVGRLVHGVADDLVSGAVKALGNGQVPIQAAAAWIALTGGIT